MSNVFLDPFANKPWMYTKPAGTENYKKWVEEWLSIILKVAENENIHLINKMDLKLKQPLDKLDDKSYDSLIKEILETSYISYWGNGNLRIYWKSLNGWADSLVKKANDMDKSLIYGLEGITEIDETMWRIPKSDIQRILDILVDQRRARWVEKENNIIKII